MSDDDFSRIEDRLGLRLPEAYRRCLAPIPIPHERGNANSQVWDDAGALIALNQSRRAEVADWPPWLFVIGQAEGDPCGYAIDIRIPDAPVWWLEQMRLGRHSGPGRESFEDWFARWVEDSGELPGDGSGPGWIIVFYLIFAAMVLGWMAWTRR